MARESVQPEPATTRGREERGMGEGEMADVLADAVCAGVGLVTERTVSVDREAPSAMADVRDRVRMTAVDMILNVTVLSKLEREQRQLHKQHTRVTPLSEQLL